MNKTLIIVLKMFAIHLERIEFVKLHQQIVILLEMLKVMIARVTMDIKVCQQLMYVKVWKTQMFVVYE